MAIWQATFHLASLEQMAKLPDHPIRLEDEAHWWAPDVSAEAMADLDATLDRSPSWSNQLQCWGRSDGNRLEVWSGGGVRVSFDLRYADPIFLAAVLHLAHSLQCFLLSEEEHMVEPSMEALLAALGVSQAARFVSNPAKYLSDYS